MNLDELFDTTARLGEPEPRGDVMARIRQAQARRRRAQLIAVPTAAIAVVAAVLVPTALIQTGKPATPPATRPTQQVTQAPLEPEPKVFVALAGSRAVKVDVASGHRTDLGPADAVTVHQGQPWLARSHGTCADSVVPPGGAGVFDARGAVGALAVSPDGTMLAYSRAATPPGPDEQDVLPCGEHALVLRDLRTGSERVWSATAGSLESLSWSADGSRLAFTQVVCCTDGETVRVLTVSERATAIDRIFALPDEHHDDAGNYCRYRFPVFVGDDLLVDEECSTPDGATRTFELKHADTGVLVLQLPADLIGIAADAQGHHLLVTLYGTPETSGTLLALNVADRTSRRLGDNLDSAHW
jgi:hypothetical protein